MDRSKSAKLMILLMALVVLVNAWIFIDIAVNKSSVDGRYVLSERELQISYDYNNLENSGVSLRIKYRAHAVDQDEPRFHYGFSKRPVWLDREKMLALGFTEQELIDDGFRLADKKEVFIALELNGDAYQTSLQNMRKWYAKHLGKPESKESELKKQLAHEEDFASRLFAIDAAAELDELTTRYQGSSNILFVKGIVRASRYPGKASEDIGRGRIESLSLPSIHVPYPLNETLKSLDFRSYNDFQPSRFDVDVNFGKKMIPWISDITLTNKTASSNTHN